MPVIVPQTLRGAAERAGRRLGRRRKRRVSPVLSQDELVASPTGVRAVKIDAGRMGRVTTSVRYIDLGENALSWRRQGDETASRSLPIETITQITLGCPTAYGHAASAPWSTLCLSAHVGKGRGTRLRRFYFAVAKPREARDLMMALQERSYGRNRVPVSRGQLLWQTARLRVVDRAKQNAVARKDIVRTLWNDALRHQRTLALSKQVAAAAETEQSTGRDNPADWVQVFNTSPLGGFFPNRQHLNERRPSTALPSSSGVNGRLMGPMAVARRRHRRSEPVLRPHTAGAIGELRRNSLGNIVVSTDQRPRTAGRIATRQKSVDDIAVSAGQQRPRTADSTKQDAGCRGAIELVRYVLPGTPSALDAQRPRTAAMKRPRTKFQERPQSAAAG